MIEQYNLSFLNLDSIQKKLLKSQSNQHGLLTDGKSSFNYGIPILMMPEFKSLYLIFKKYVKIYCTKHNIPKAEFINSWYNVTNPGNKLKLHDHGQKGLSGAFYVSVGKKSVPLIFPDTEQKIKIKPYPGLLIIFPSSFPHCTDKEQEKRIVISFNTDYLNGED